MRLAASANTNDVDSFTAAGKCAARLHTTELMTSPAWRSSSAGSIRPENESPLRLRLMADSSGDDSDEAQGTIKHVFC